MDKIAFIAPTEEYKVELIQYMQNHNDTEDLIIEVLDPNGLFEQADRLIEEGAKAFIARGGTYYDLNQYLSIPVIPFSITTEDILSALNQAKALNKKVYLVIEEHVTFDYEEWRDLLAIDIHVVRIQNIPDIKNKIEKIAMLEENIVLVGGAYTIELGAKHQLPCVFIGNKLSFFLDTYNQVKTLLLESMKRQKRVKVLEMVLANMADGVVSLSTNGTIELFNKKAEKHLGKRASDVINRSIHDVFPKISHIANLENSSEEIMTYNKKSLTLRVLPISVDNTHLGNICTIRDITEIQEYEKRLRFKLNKKGLLAKHTFDEMIIVDHKMTLMIDYAKRAAATNSTILIYGESGTGKELLAQSIHNCSQRKSSPFVAINCAALSESLLESELFGYEEGAFTGARKGGKVGLFELAHGGTIFLDEINSVTRNLQTKLLRIIEEKEVMRIGSDHIIPLDVRIIAATNEDLIKQVADQQFRGDLFFRLSVIELSIPPLRERKDAIMPLFMSFLETLIGFEVSKDEIPQELQKWLLTHPWHGNVRELRNIAERYVVLGNIEDITHLAPHHKPEPDLLDENLQLNLKEISHAVEGIIIDNLLNQGRTKKEIANLLGISRTALYQKLNRGDTE